MSYQVIFSPKSYRQIKAMKDEKLKERLKSALMEIGENPWHKGTIKVEKYDNIRRKRVGKYRIFYTIDRNRMEVLIVKIERRSESTYK